MSRAQILEKYADLFPSCDKWVDTFIEDLFNLSQEQDSAKLIQYWETLGEAGTMENILNTFNWKDHSKIKILIYSMSGFLNARDYMNFKKKLDINGHILEFVFAIFARPFPNLDIIRYFITVAKNPRHYQPQIIQWFYIHVTPLIADDMPLYKRFLENCTLAVQRWVNTNKHSKNTKCKKKIDPILYDLIPKSAIPIGLI